MKRRTGEMPGHAATMVVLCLWAARMEANAKSYQIPKAM
jgi:hypothetical protein